MVKDGGDPHVNTAMTYLLRWYSATVISYACITRQAQGPCLRTENRGPGSPRDLTPVGLSAGVPGPTPCCPPPHHYGAAGEVEDRVRRVSASYATFEYAWPALVCHRAGGLTVQPGMGV